MQEVLNPGEITLRMGQRYSMHRMQERETDQKESDSKFEVLSPKDVNPNPLASSLPYNFF